ncbi:MAG: hypothetical protein AGIKBDMD_00529 [Synergistaceae bacterium]
MSSMNNFLIKWLCTVIILALITGVINGGGYLIRSFFPRYAGILELVFVLLVVGALLAWSSNIKLGK